MPTVARRILNTITQHGFVSQPISNPTTDFGSTIDRVFYRHFAHIDITVLDCYFSDHDYLVLHPIL